MKYNKLQGLKDAVSEVCLGTMTFGEQNSETESHKILDLSLERGVNFYDTAEMYPIPPSSESYHETERIIGKWGKFQTEREKIVMATKVIGPSSFMTWIRGGSLKLDQSNIIKACEGSLKRLNTDYIDLYQIHWPARQTNFFGQLGFQEPQEEKTTPIKETLDALASLVEQKKIRAIGLSNETPWGIMTFLNTAKEYNLPAVSTVQNPYSLLNRSYEVGCSEISYRENVKLLSYSPLGFGVLTGKYIEGKDTPKSRLNLFDQYTRYSHAKAEEITKRYYELAKSFGISLTKLALSFCYSRPFMGSTIIGATTCEQLIENIDASNYQMTVELEEQINKIHETFPNPCP
ncbi:MAG: aldo/keto reductase [Halobacteriovoraceae bacterium]|nr:aldo/keto reductase [Halobacteriovoraceae bacterium]